MTHIRLLSSCCDNEVFPATLLAATYHERWEVEGSLDEIKTHELSANRPAHLRSQLPRTTVQEFYGMLLAHLAIRTLMYEAATRSNIDPDRPQLHRQPSHCPTPHCQSFHQTHLPPFGIESCSGKSQDRHCPPEITAQIHAG